MTILGTSKSNVVTRNSSILFYFNINYANVVRKSGVKSIRKDIMYTAL